MPSAVCQVGLIDPFVLPRPWAESQPRQAGLSLSLSFRRRNQPEPPFAVVEVLRARPHAPSKPVDRLPAGSAPPRLARASGRQAAPIDRSLAAGSARHARRCKGQQRRGREGQARASTKERFHRGLFLAMGCARTAGSRTARSDCLGRAGHSQFNAHTDSGSRRLRCARGGRGGSRLLIGLARALPRILPRPLFTDEVFGLLAGPRDPFAQGADFAAF